MSPNPRSVPADADVSGGTGHERLVVACTLNVVGAPRDTLERLGAAVTEALEAVAPAPPPIRVAPVAELEPEPGHARHGVNTIGPIEPFPVAKAKLGSRRCACRADGITGASNRLHR